MDRLLEYNIPIEYSGKKLNDFLKDMNFTSGILTKLRQDSSLSLINNVPCFLNTIINHNDHIQILIPEVKSSEKIVPVNLPFNVLFEDDDIVVVNKPPKMPVHPSLNNYENTLGNAAAYYYRNETSPFVYRCINRLDRDTSGLTIIAKNPYSGSILATEKYTANIKRTYFAIVEDNIAIADCGTINAPIGRVNGSTIERTIDYKNGDKAITHYKVLKRFNSMALLSLNLETGRTHQIRVHMASVSHPLIGDFLYNPGNKVLDRQALHAGILEFLHPVKKEMLTIKAPLPIDMMSLTGYDPVTE